jgi:hypothetical protein
MTWGPIVAPPALERNRPDTFTRHHPLATLRHALQVNPAETLRAE